MHLEKISIHGVNYWAYVDLVTGEAGKPQALGHPDRRLHLATVIDSISLVCVLDNDEAWKASAPVHMIP